MSVPHLVAHGLIEQAKEIYQSDHSGGCRILSMGDQCQCVLCRLDALHEVLNKEYPLTDACPDCGSRVEVRKPTCGPACIQCPDCGWVSNL